MGFLKVADRAKIVKLEEKVISSKLVMMDTRKMTLCILEFLNLCQMILLLKI